jgi:hypothetical protein
MRRSLIIKIILMATIYFGLSGSANALLIVEVSATDTTFSMTLNGQAEASQLNTFVKHRLFVGFGGGLADSLYSWVTDEPAQVTLSHSLPGGITLIGGDANPNWIEAEHSVSVENVTFNDHTYTWTVADPSQAPDLSMFGLHLGAPGGCWQCIPGTPSWGPVITATVVPEPNTALLLGIGLVGLAARWRQV